MKKIAGCIILCVMLVCSCTNQNENQLEVNSHNELSIEKALENYNNTLVKSTSGVRVGFWGKVLLIAAADVVGYLIGFAVETYDSPGGNPHLAGAITGGVASYTAGKILGFAVPPPSDDPNDPNNDDFNLVYDVPSDYSEQDMGPDHNNILHMVYTSGSPIEEIITTYYDEATAQKYCSNQAFNKSFENAINEYIDADYNIDILLNNGFTPSYSIDILTLFFEGLNNCESDQQASELISFYSDSVIESDEFNQEQKNGLVGTFSVARSSINYWFYYAE